MYMYMHVHRNIRIRHTTYDIDHDQFYIARRTRVPMCFDLDVISVSLAKIVARAVRS